MIANDAESILRICGIDTYLHVGCGQSQLVFELLKRSLDAYGIDNSPDIIARNTERVPERFFQYSLLNYPFKQQTFGTIIIGAELLSFKTDELITVFKALERLAKHNLVLYFPPEVKQQFVHRPELMSRLFWEQIAIQAGFRRHPRGMLVVPYHELEDESLNQFIFFERVPDAANERFSLEWLLKNRDLHMDMLRESGRRSDGHVSRYVLAAEQIRPGDIVLDAACGLGYGTAVLAACSPGAKFIGVDIDPESVAYAEVNFASDNPAISYKACDVTKLSFLADHSVDAVISYETIEHVEDYDIFLAEVRRVLKPDGRFIGSVPNLWCDETGKDPNPYHYHVFDWEKLQAAVGKYFIVDGRWAQIAGGGFKLWNGKRLIESIPINYKENIDTEWWLISACANPFSAEKVAYTNPFQKDIQTTTPLPINYAGYYDNPWIYKVIAQLSEQLSDQKVLVDFCIKVIREARLGSADQGAALYTVCCKLLESGIINFKDVVSLIELINAYDQAFDRNNPHAYRWSIALHYVGGRLLLALGKREDAHTAFLTCAEMDPLVFSPLLAIKTVSARIYSGLIYASINNFVEAKNQFKLGIKEVHRVLQGNWETLLGNFDNPLSFGLKESAELLDIANQCSQALHAIEREGSAPGYLWDKINLKNTDYLPLRA